MTTFISKFRKLTVSATLVKNKWSRSIKPKIILSGDWMKEAGFTIGSQIEIEVRNNQLILKRLEG